jgi:hypothetical protein
VLNTGQPRHGPQVICALPKTILAYMHARALMASAFPPVNVAVFWILFADTECCGSIRSASAVEASFPL